MCVYDALPIGDMSDFQRAKAVRDAHLAAKGAQSAAKADEFKQKEAEKMKRLLGSMGLAADHFKK